jgi:antitoxin PrlF
MYMVKSTKGSASVSPPSGGAGCCNVEAVVSVDERGQMVLPKEIRDKVGIKAGDKLAIVAMQQNGAVCCVTLIKVEALAGMVKSMLGPMMKEIF